MLIPEWMYWTSTFSSIAIEQTSHLFSKVTGKYFTRMADCRFGRYINRSFLRFSSIVIELKMDEQRANGHKQFVHPGTWFERLFNRPYGIVHER